MVYTVPILSIGFMVVAAVAGIAIPVVLFFVFRKKYKADIAPFFIGCAVFIIFALLLEGSLNRLIFTSNVGNIIQNNIWLYGIFGGLMAGLFEETGRYAAFKTVLKKNFGNDWNALMYGAGHGGFEAFYILVFSMVSNIVLAVMLNHGMVDQLTTGVTDDTTLRTLYAAFAALATTAPAAFLMSIVERLAAVGLHLSYSVLVWFAAKGGGQHFWFYPLALLLHALVDAAAVILASYISNIWIILAIVYLLTACTVVIAVAVWKKCTSNKRLIAEIKAEEDA